MFDPDAPEPGAGKLFVDRVPESRALAESLVAHSAALRASEIEPRVHKNVLMFFGESGVGKTELSSRLNKWLKGELVDNPEWGPTPTLTADITVCWDAFESHGHLDPLELLLQLRRKIGLVRDEWLPFDLALHAMYRSMRAGSELRLTTPSGLTTTMSQIVGSAISEGAGTFIPGAGIAVDASRSVLSQVRDRSRAKRALRDYPGLEDLILECERLPGTPAKFAEVAGRVAFMLTREMGEMPPGERPLGVIFVDHFERLQDSGDSPLGESLVNRLAVRLPYFLFVVSGRNSLRWHERDATHLDTRGADRWPLLIPENKDVEPRQHAVGYLSERDAEGFLRESFRLQRIEIESDLIDQLVGEAGGWPIHLDMMVAAAQEKSRQGLRVCVEDLSGPLPQLVERVLKDLPHDEAEAFRAACLLPYFDIDLVAKASGVRAGAVERLVRRSIVRPLEASHASPTYPYRIHDTLRRIVREAGSSPSNGWAAADWAHHAVLALDESRRRFDAAMAIDDDRAALASLALALNLAAENNVFGEWFPDAVRRSPGARALGPLIPSQTPATANAEIADLLEFVRLRERDLSEEVGDEFRVLMDRGNGIAPSAGLWLAYEHRRLGRSVDAVNLLAEMEELFPVRADFYRLQQAVTLGVNRQFVDAAARMPALNDRQRSVVEYIIRRAHGHAAGASAQIIERAGRSDSRRFKLELLSDSLTYKLREGGLTLDEATSFHRVETAAAHEAAQAQAASVIGQLQLFDDAAFTAARTESAELSRRRHQPYATHAMLLAMGGWARRDDALLDEAHRITSSTVYRGSAWIPIEIALAHLGLSVEETHTEWLEPLEDVRQRWLAIFERTIDDARRRSNSVKDAI